MTDVNINEKRYKSITANYDELAYELNREHNEGWEVVGSPVQIFRGRIESPILYVLLQLSQMIPTIIVDSPPHNDVGRF